MEEEPKKLLPTSTSCRGRGCRRRQLSILSLRSSPLEKHHSSHYACGIDIKGLLNHHQIISLSDGMEVFACDCWLYEDDKWSESDGLISRYNFAVKLKKYIYIYKDKAANCV